MSKPSIYPDIRLLSIPCRPTVTIGTMSRDKDVDEAAMTAAADLQRFETQMRARLDAVVRGEQARMNNAARARSSSQLASSSSASVAAAPSAATPASAHNEVQRERISRHLHAMGILQTRKPDEVRDLSSASALEHSSIDELKRLLSSQRGLANNHALMQSLPDKGEKIRMHIRQIEAVLERKEKEEQAALSQAEGMMGDVQLHGDAKQSNGHPKPTAASSSSTTPASTAASSTTASARPTSTQFPISSRGSATAHASALAAASRLQQVAKQDHQVKFWRQPPPVIGLEEAAHLMRVKDADWAQSFELGGLRTAAVGEQHPYREPTHYDEEEEEDEEVNAALRGEFEAEDEEEEDEEIDKAIDAAFSDLDGELNGKQRPTQT